MTLPASYVEAHRYDGAAMERGRRNTLVPCEIQPRDVAVVDDVRRHKFLTSPQLRELWWPGRSSQAADRRLLALFRAGLLDRFRPVTRRGSYPWTYQLAVEGHRLLQRAGLLSAGLRFTPRTVYDYGHVLHELQLNAWVLAYRRHVGADLVGWEGETDIQPPASARSGQPPLVDGWSVEGLRTPRARPVRPDAVLDVDISGEQRTFLVEYDRTRRVDKNFEKFRRYDSYLCWWWRDIDRGDASGPPYLLFICQDDEQRRLFAESADRELTGHLRHPSGPPERDEHVGRRNILFTVEHDAHAGTLEAWRLPRFPSGHSERRGGLHRVRIAARSPADRVDDDRPGGAIRVIRDQPVSECGQG